MSEWPSGVGYAHARLGLIMELLLTQTSLGEVGVHDPWEAWWISYRLARPCSDLGLNPHTAPGACRDCRAAAADLATFSPPRHTDELGGSHSCDCLRRWCVAMRSSAPTPTWPSTRLVCALIKPHAPREAILTALTEHYCLLHTTPTRLRRADVRRLYPDAYGADFVAARDSYLTSGPVEVALLLDETAPTDPRAVKGRIRERFGGDQLRNHLHMADNPGECFADIAHLAGPDVLTGLYDTHERDLAPHRLDYYRTVLGHHPTGPGGIQPSTT